MCKDVTGGCWSFATSSGGGGGGGGTGGSGILSINGDTTPAQKIVGTGNIIVTTSGGTTTVYGSTTPQSTIPYSVNNSWVPALQGNNVSSTYSSQVGTFSNIAGVCSVSFSMVVSNYQTPGATSVIMNLPVQATGAGNNQEINVFIKEGSGNAFTALTGFGVITPGTQAVAIAIDFQLNPGDTWQGNFTYNATVPTQSTTITSTFNQSWVPAFQGNNVGTTYFSQNATFSQIGSTCTVSLQMQVNNYQTPSATTMYINLPLNPAPGNNQAFMMYIKEASAPSNFTSLIGFGTINTNAGTASIDVDFALMSGDLWQANFTYNTV